MYMYTHTHTHTSRPSGQDIWRSSMVAMRSCFVRSVFSVCSWLVLNSSTQKSLCFTSSSCCFASSATMSSMAFFTRVNASSFTSKVEVCVDGFVDALKKWNGCVKISMSKLVRDMIEKSDTITLMRETIG